MRIAYIVSAYQYPEQLVRLISRLNTNAASFWVHVDKKTDDRIYHHIVRHVGHLPNVCFLKRHTCYWGGFGHVKATIEGIRAITRNNVPFDYAILLTGQDYPIKSNSHINAFLQERGGKSFMEYFALPSGEWQNGGLDRIEVWHFRLFNRHFRFPKDHRFSMRRKFPVGFRPFGGSSYWCLSRVCIEYIDHFVSENPAFVNFFKFVDVPDELFFQTIVLNSPLRETLVNDDLRYTDWRDPNSGSPAILRKSDFDKLVRSSKLFARKFDMTIDAEVLDMIDRDLLNESCYES